MPTLPRPGGRPGAFAVLVQRARARRWPKVTERPFNYEGQENRS